MSFDDDATDDSVGFRPPPHPDDRLWRHPSELRAARRRRATPVGRQGRWGTVAVATAGVVLVAAGVSLATLGLRDHSSTRGPVIQAATSPRADEPGVLSEYAFANLDGSDSARVDVARQVAPSVVRVDTGATRGSGVMIRADGVVLTSFSVVGNHSHVAIGLGDGRLVTGSTIGSDPLTGVALVDLPGAGYAATQLTHVPSADLAGEPALAFGIDHIGRLVLGAGDVGPTPSRVQRPGQGVLDGVLVVETVVDPVAQGGPVVDEVGTLIGLTTWTDDTQSYATPISVVRKVVDDVLATGTPQHTWLGIDGYDVIDNGWPAGVGVAGVAPDGPSAGVLRTGDIIVAVDEQLVSHMSALVAELRHHDPGDVVQVSYRRGSQNTAETEPLVLARRPMTLDL